MRHLLPLLLVVYSDAESAGAAVTLRSIRRSCCSMPPERTSSTRDVPSSTMRTCIGCHDTDYIEGHSFHVGLGYDERTAVGFVDGGRPWDYSPGPFGRWGPVGLSLSDAPG